MASVMKENKIIPGERPTKELFRFREGGVVEPF